MKGHDIEIFNAFGEASNQLNAPSGIAVTNSGDIFIVDKNNRTIKIFCRNGTFKYNLFDRQLKFGCKLRWRSPTKVAVHPKSGNLAVLENSVSDSCYNYNALTIVEPFGGINYYAVNYLVCPVSLDYDRHGCVVVLDKSTPPRVITYTQVGKRVGEFTSPLLEDPTALAVNDKDEVFICDAGMMCIFVFNRIGQCLRRIGTLTTAPVALCLTHSGYVVVACYKSVLYVNIYNPDGGQAILSHAVNIKGTAFTDIAWLGTDSLVICSSPSNIFVYKIT